MMMSSSWTASKPALKSDRGLIACQNPYAALAGARVLAQGGNAVDAAVTTALLLSVVEPWLSGVGGGGFLLWGEGGTGTTRALDFNVIAPGALDPADYPLTESTDGDWFNWPAVAGERNLIGYESICVPGAIDGLATALAELGTMRWEDALAPAIEAAQSGLTVDWYTSMCIAIDAPGLARFPASAEIFLCDGWAPRAPERQRNLSLPMPAKARLLRHLAKEGPRAFYEGAPAKAMAADLAAGGSRITEADLAGYHCRWAQPLVGDYRGHALHVMPGLSGGPSLLDAFARLEAAWAPGSGEPDGDSALAYVHALREAYRHRFRELGHAGSMPGLHGECTSHISVVDGDGNMVALTNTLLSRFGSKVVLPSAGILMNNSVMWFDPRPGQPNSIAGGAQPLANMCPVLAVDEDGPALAIGAAGGRQIFPAVFQLLSYMLDFGMDMETAFHAPRLDTSTSTVVVDTRTHPSIVSLLTRHFPVLAVEETVYPVSFAIPTAVRRRPGHPRFEAMAHPVSPWATVAEGRSA